MDDAGSMVITPQAATLRNPIEDWLRDAFVTNPSLAGVPVNAQTARGLPSVWASISKIAGHIGSMPLKVYRRVGESAEVARNHPAHYLISKRPNDFSGPAMFRETLQHHALLHGNGRAAILRNGRGDPDQLIILDPLKWAIVVTEPMTVGGIDVPQMKWHVLISNPKVQIKDANVLHIAGLSDDGITGLSLLDAARNSLGVAIGQQRRQATSIRNGARIPFLLSAPPGAFRTPEAAQQFIDGFNQYHSGSDNVDRVGLLREGITPQSIGQNSQQMQELEQMQASKQDVALLFAVESMLGDKSGQSYNSLEQRNRAYLTDCLQRWITRWQEECGIKLLTTQQYDSDEYYFRFVTQSLLLATTKERYDVYKTAREINVMSPNDIRKLEDMNERTDAGGDSYDNPNITVTATAAQQDGSSSSSDATDGEAGDQPAVAKLSRLVTAQVRSLVGVEQSRIQAATTKANFLNWLDEFYADWQGKLGELATNAGASADVSVAWCDASRNALLEVAGKTDKRGLGEAVRAELATWQARIDRLTADILGA